VDEQREPLATAAEIDPRVLLVLAARVGLRDLELIEQTTPSSASLRFGRFLSISSAPRWKSPSRLLMKWSVSVSPNSVIELFLRYWFAALVAPVKIALVVSVSIAAIASRTTRSTR
jgi:hypothetical protein